MLLHVAPNGAGASVIGGVAQVVIEIREDGTFSTSTYLGGTLHSASMQLRPGADAAKLVFAQIQSVIALGIDPELHARAIENDRLWRGALRANE